MSIAQFAPSMSRGSSRWLLLASLALNLFFIGAAVALAVRPPPPAWNRDVLVRIGRIADALPPADGALLRKEIDTNRSAIENAQKKYHAARDAIRQTLRQEPFDAGAMRTAMADMRSARQTFDQTLQGVFATAAPEMSSAGRHALADWRPGRKTPGK